MGDVAVYYYVNKLVQACNAVFLANQKIGVCTVDYIG